MVDDRKPIVKRKKRTRKWWDMFGREHEQTTDHVKFIRVRDKQHKR